jgi:hypothetical protein
VITVKTTSDYSFPCPAGVPSNTNYKSVNQNQQSFFRRKGKRAKGGEERKTHFQHFQIIFHEIYQVQWKRISLKINFGTRTLVDK